MADINDTPLTERAAALRTAIRKAIKSPTRNRFWPEGAKLSVRCDTASMYSAINVTVTAPDAWALNADGDLTAEARQLGDVLESWLAEYTGYAWGNVTINDRSAGSVASSNWRPGQD